jgi:hypothetical protein
MGCSNRLKADAADDLSATTASEGFSQPNYFVIEKTALRTELHFLPDYFRKRRQAILNLQYLNLTMLQLGAVTDESAPGGMQRLIGDCTFSSNGSCTLLADVLVFYHCAH